MLKTKTRVVLAFAVLLFAACFTDTGVRETSHAEDVPSTEGMTIAPELRAAYIASSQRSAGAEFHFDSQGKAANAPQGLVAELAGGALSVRSLGAARWSVQLRWDGIGRGQSRESVAPANAPEVNGNRASYLREDGSEEWYLNGPLGVEQGFEIRERPEGTGPLVLRIDVSGDLEPALSADANEVSLNAATGKRVLRYTDLFAKDADGRALACRMGVDGDVIKLHVDDTDARYPVSIDPLVWVERKEAHRQRHGDRQSLWDQRCRER